MDVLWMALLSGFHSNFCFFSPFKFPNAQYFNFVIFHVFEFAFSFLLCYIIAAQYIYIYIYIYIYGRPRKLMLMPHYAQFVLVGRLCVRFANGSILIWPISLNRLIWIDLNWNSIIQNFNSLISCWIRLKFVNRSKICQSHITLWK